MRKHCALGLAAFHLSILAAPALAGDIRTDGKLVSTVAPGIAPLEVSSSTLVSNLNADLLDGLEGGDLTPSVDNLILVGKSRGHFTSIQAALDSITDAATDNWYVIRVGPGVYAETLTMKPFVAIVGHGIFETVVEVEGPGDVTAVTGSSASILSDLAIVARSLDGGDATALVNPFVVRRGRLFAQSALPGHTVGLKATGNVGVFLEDTEVSAWDGEVNTALFMETPAQVEALGGRFDARSQATPTATNYGVRRSAVTGSGDLRLDRVTISVFSGAIGWGIRSADGPLRLRRSDILAHATSQATGILFQSKSMTMEDSSITTSGSATLVTGLQLGSASAKVKGSTIGSAVDVPSGSTLRAAHTEVAGTLDGAGSYLCIGLYDQNFAPLPCP